MSNGYALEQQHLLIADAPAPALRRAFTVEERAQLDKCRRSSEHTIACMTQYIPTLIPGDPEIALAKEAIVVAERTISRIDGVLG